jgi:hypothetical protein
MAHSKLLIQQICEILNREYDLALYDYVAVNIDS